MVIGQPGDRYEREADQVADQLVHNLQAEPQQAEILEPRSPLMPASSHGTFHGMSIPPGIAARIHSAQNGGYPVDTKLQRQVEASTGEDFKDVRIHTDAEADVLNRDLGALAFTIGRDVFFRAGCYKPNQKEGQRLIAHELTHVVQQSSLEQSTGMVQAWSFSSAKDRFKSWFQTKEAAFAIAVLAAVATLVAAIFALFTGLAIAAAGLGIVLAILAVISLLQQYYQNKRDDKDARAQENRLKAMEEKIDALIAGDPDKKAVKQAELDILAQDLAKKNDLDDLANKDDLQGLAKKKDLDDLANKNADQERQIQQLNEAVAKLKAELALQKSPKRAASKRARRQSA
jgi:hypothetical protein